MGIKWAKTVAYWLLSLGFMDESVYSDKEWLRK